MITNSPQAAASCPPAAMSIDVEDWFHTENLKAAIARDSWDDRESRVERNTDRMLEMMARHDVRCTCFILGWVADKAPQLVKRIADAGHEIASHGYGHELIYDIGPDAFRRDIDRARKLLEDLTGHRVRGYR
ncbi:MAG: polysaccharide deacetylase family protein, partial [Planctomycetota bacterium]